MSQSANVDPRMQQAVDLHRLRRLQEAESAYRDIVAASPGNGDAHHLLAVLLLQTGRADEAMPFVERAISILPGSAQYHATLGRIHHALSRADDAVAPLERAVELDPSNAQAWSDLGAVLQATGRVDEAEAVYRRAMDVDATLALPRYNLATILHGRGDLAGAIELMRAVVAKIGDNSMLRTTLAGYLLEAGDVVGALAQCEAALSSDQHQLLAMTFKSVALLRLGDRGGAARLLDLARLVHVEKIAAPPGFASLEAFNAALEAHALGHPTLEHERRQNATRNGRHTANLLLGEKGPMAALERVFDEAVRRYLLALPGDPANPYLTTRPVAWQLQAWAVVMHAQGHQLAHTHPDGWVSGVYYAKVPDVVSEDDPQRAGWIEFGRPLPELLGEAEPIVRALPPKPGTLVLFPSYLYHRTVPFSSPTHRISIAFDAVPGRRRIAVAPEPG